MGKRKLAKQYAAPGGSMPMDADTVQGPMGRPKGQNKLPKHTMHARGKNRGLPKA